jgi:hypothetical protein
MPFFPTDFTQMQITDLRDVMEGGLRIGSKDFGVGRGPGYETLVHIYKTTRRHIPQIHNSK